ncbi:UDP-N-Acetylglucosamine 2-epimerase [Mycolicibacterium rutilum]|uniref:UDP-N-acetylglucosamine 2-epimerase (non-hydrolyzing) n=1 Tax=Mycolicibacterium rutilum TaxID=370526 RepID=A0A1H6IL04_MYCRU|nr:UDP-N-acetylglucosamine 2-epimerase (non-hydrolyzing) [Mycolicibacterium rutilum]SEH50220.1 UDP-N-Acetylglucosamine 2-epimerase [Mycolicibacterium rutilum]
MVPEVWLIGGTRPEAVKLAPLALALDQSWAAPVVVGTGQHPTMFDQALAAFGLTPGLVLEPERLTGTQAELVSQLTHKLDDVMRQRMPSAVVVQGDTTSALVGALTAFWNGVPVVHLEAGLRSHDLQAPFPEEANRRMIAQIAALHLAPTPRAAANLRAEGVAAEHIHVIGNTVVDAVLAIAGRVRPFGVPVLRVVEEQVAAGARLMLVTVHRRESWGEPLRSVLHAVRDVLAAHPDLVAVLPAHPNPVVRGEVEAVLGDEPRMHITAPLDYPDLIRTLELSALVLSDSGGIQEEAPSFGVPVLVLRNTTERREAIDAGCAVLVGTDRATIRREAARRLAQRRVDVPQQRNPFGDGHAGKRAAAAVRQLLTPVRTGDHPVSAAVVVVASPAAAPRARTAR